TVATGVYCLVTGKRRDSNVYFVQSGETWVLVDTGWRGRAELINSAAETLSGVGTRPRAIVLTHVHPDHAGSASELAHMWDVTVYVHPDELPLPPLWPHHRRLGPCRAELDVPLRAGRAEPYRPERRRSRPAGLAGHPRARPHP